MRFYLNYSLLSVFSSNNDFIKYKASQNRYIEGALMYTIIQIFFVLATKRFMDDARKRLKLNNFTASMTSS